VAAVNVVTVYAPAALDRWPAGLDQAERTEPDTFVIALDDMVVLGAPA
jgi:hypothetical protein